MSRAALAVRRLDVSVVDVRVRDVGVVRDEAVQELAPVVERLVLFCDDQHARGRAGENDRDLGMHDRRVVSHRNHTGVRRRAERRRPTRDHEVTIGVEHGADDQDGSVASRLAMASLHCSIVLCSLNRRAESKSSPARFSMRLSNSSASTSAISAPSTS